MKTRFVLIVLLIVGSCTLVGQESQTVSSVGSGTYLGKSIPLKDFPLVKEDASGKSTYRIIPNNFPVNDFESPNSLPIGGDPIRQNFVNKARQASNLALSFDGPNVSQGQGIPPDPSGAVGPNHYVSGVNSAIIVYDKEGNVLAGPVSLGNFIGDGQNSGDPIVMYDQLADRWFVSQFNPGSNGLAIAISETPDPTGAFLLYEFSLDSFPDYPHYAIWHDAYYLTANKAGQNIYALDRDVMLAGGANPQILGFNLPGVINNPNTVFSPEPAYLLGNEFDPDTPGYITYLQDDAWGAGFDHLAVWELDIDFDAPTNSTISAPLRIPVTPFDSFIAPFGSGELNQPGTAQRLDMITGVISYASHYRPFEDHNSWLITFNVDVQEDNTTVGVRWVELRNNDTDEWSVFQEGTYAPADGNSRFMGSGAIDEQGNIGLAFNIGGAEKEVGIAYTGRFLDDPLGVMTIPEETIIEGNGVQTTTNRFGDYSQLSMDPDNFTFWHIAEYFTNNNFWSTRIGVFNISQGLENDLGVISINTPEDGTLTTTESVEITIRNFGTQTKTDIDVQLTLDGVVVANETFTESIAAGASATYTFEQTLDLSIEGQIYLLEATTVFAQDEFPDNDGVSKTVQHLFENDLGVVEIITPESASGLSDTEIVMVTIENFGTSDQTNFDISLDLDGVVATETVSASVAAGQTITYTFTETLDLSNFQDYVITVATDLTGDQNAANDAQSITIANFICQPMSNCSGFNDGVTQIALADQSFTVDCDGTSDGYTDNTDIVFNFVLEDNPFEGVLQMGFNNSVFALWIDFNDNNIFETDELISNESVAAANTDFAFTIDFEDFPNAIEGEHLMRLRGEDESAVGDVLDPCGDLQFGRTNDFTANVSGLLSLQEQQINNGELIVTTLANNNFDINLTTEFDGRLFMAVFNIVGQQLTYKPVAQVGSGFRINLDMSAMPAGVYVVRLGSSDPETFRTAKIIVR